MDARAEEIADRLDGLVTWAALREAGMPAATAGDLVARLRRVHDGVHLTGRGRITAHQRHLAATLTGPGTVLSHASAAAAWGLRRWSGAFEVVTRPGSGGPRRRDGLLVCRSTTLAEHTTHLDGVPITTPARTIVDLAAHLTRTQRDKAAREAIRLGPMTATELLRTTRAHPRRRGTSGLLELAERLEDLPIARTRSDAEARSLELIALADLPLPQVNRRSAGEEYDLAWPTHCFILEIDGPQYHRDPAEDARKTRAWVAAGWRVRRLSSDVVFHDPDRLLEIVRRGLAARSVRDDERPSSPAQPESMHVGGPRRATDPALYPLHRNH